jgi:hypothetical protein
MITMAMMIIMTILGSTYLYQISICEPHYSMRFPRQMKGVHLAAYFGLVEMMTDLLESHHAPESKDRFNDRTPLSWATGNGHKAVVELLLDNKVDPDSRDKDGRTPLSCAAENGQEAIVELLEISNSLT